MYMLCISFLYDFILKLFYFSNEFFIFFIFAVVLVFKLIDFNSGFLELTFKMLLASSFR